MQVQVNTNKLVAKSRDYINENEYNIHEVNFDFAEEFTVNLVKVALFTRGTNTYKMIIANNKCNIPSEILQEKGTFILGVYAYEENNGELILRYSPSPIQLFVSSGSYIEDAQNSEPITPSELEQYQQALQDGLSEVSETITSMTDLIDEVQTKLDNGEFNGQDGQDGYTPVKGVDYWTETEQNEIISTATTNVENNFASTIATIQSNSNNALNTANTANSTANTAKSIAEGANQALSYANYQAMITAFNSLADDVYRIGQNVMIVTLNVPDLWISEIEQTSEAYTYTTDEAFTTLLQTNGYVKVGYYRLSPLETQKVDLTDYYTKEDTVSKISEMISVDDVQINGTSIVSDGVANVPIATMPTSGTDAGNLGLTCFKRGRGISISATDNSIYIDYPTLAQVQAGNNTFKPVTTAHQHASTFYGLAKAAGDTTQSQSSNAVGNYTEDAKVAIQKMLGIYEAPWELIREDTFTNEEETSHEITTDGNGQAFELTDVRIIFWLPVQNVDASLGDYGKIQAYYDSNKYDTNYLTAFTQVAGSASKVGLASWEQKNGMIELTFLSSGTNGTSKAISSIIRSDGSPNAFMYVPEGRIYTKVVIPSVKGTGAYKLYGRRKWQ